MKRVMAVTRKELQSYFGSPTALLFVAAYLAVALYMFFWQDAFFARGIADVRPLFRWMPLLLVFLVAALTMRQWSEEQRTGTLEVLLTLPASPLQLVLGKFAAVMAQVLLALGLTVFLPLTVSLIGNMDWGPVIGGYLASILLAGAYTAIGLFVSSRTDNQIVALIGTASIGAALYLVGTSGFADLAGPRLAAVLQSIGTSSRFTSIERGVVDLRDLAYYLSLTALFIGLNVWSLESRRWGRGEASRTGKRGIQWATGLLAVNLALLNAWLYPVRGLRADLTAQRQFSLSPATRNLLAQLEEPLLIRGYLSEKTHPLLAPLVPTVADMLEEYRVAGRGRVQVEVIDPSRDPEMENEANQVYGISPTPFQVAGRYETSIINSYFDILVRYGDQSATLDFADLIEITSRRDGGIDVGLRNLEYDLTSAIKKTVYGFQSADAVLASLAQPATLTLYVTPNTLPDALRSVPDTVRKVAEDLGQRSKGKLVYRQAEPGATGDVKGAQQLYEEYGIQPFAVSLFSADRYYLHMVLDAGDKSQWVYPEGDLSESSIKAAIDAALKRSAPGFLQVVGLWTPPAPNQQSLTGQPAQSLSGWTQISEYLGREYRVETVTLSDGAVPADVDVLVVVAPRDLSDVQRYAVDQYIMRGGTVIVAAGNYGLTSDPYYGGIALEPLKNGLGDVLASYGITVEQRLVLDRQNEPFPMAVTRQVGNLQFQEYQAVSYPFFVDVRSDGMAKDSPIVSNLPAVTLNWASPVTVDMAKNAANSVTTLLQSSAQSWTTEDTNIQPNTSLYPVIGFPEGEDKGRHTIAVSVEGTFDSAFAGKGAPEGLGGSTQAASLQRSAEGAKLVVFGSAEFLDDVVFSISSSMTADRYINSLKLMQNAVAWATEDAELLSIRARGSFTRVLNSMSAGSQSFWEGANYVLALLSLGAIAVVWNGRRKAAQPMDLIKPESGLAQERKVTP